MTLGECITLLDLQSIFLYNGAFVSTWHSVYEKSVRNYCGEPSAVAGIWLLLNLLIPPPSNLIYLFK